MGNFKSSYQKNLINKLNEENRTLKSENNSLLIINSTLTNENSCLKKSLHDIESEHRDSMYKYREKMREAECAKDEYERLIKRARIIISDYQKKMDVLLREFSKANK